MQVTKDKVVSVSYKLSVNDFDGRVVESVNEEKPLTFIYENGMMLQKFEEGLKGLSKGSSFEFKISKDDAYGTHSDTHIIDLPKHVFEVDGKLDPRVAEGNRIPLRDKDGNILNGKINAIADNSITVDFNHPLAGHDLFFTGEVVGIREATEKELECGQVGEKENCNGDCQNC